MFHTTDNETKNTHRIILQVIRKLKNVLKEFYNLNQDT